jgi:hypothetical protein
MSSWRLLLVTIMAATALMFAYNHSFTNELLITTHPAIAQVPPVPSPPEADEETIAGSQLPATDNGQSLLTQSATPTNPNIPSPTIQISSHQDGSQVPVGGLTIQGTSSDNQENNCQVYADVNDISPLQNATAAGVNGGDDYSQWTFTYTQDYQLINQGVNELTAKISCFDNGVSTIPLSEWHSVNVTGVVSSGTITPAPAPTLPATQTPTTDEAPRAEQGGSFIPSPITPPSLPFATSEQPSDDLSQGLGDGDEGDDDEGDDDDGGDEGDDDGDDDDSGEGDDG